tara:strand:+ start:644 stop:1006 length:363 start_codon:yes stop_codon:yes gene_type:complete
MTAMNTQKCLDGKTLVIGPAILTDGVRTALNELKSCKFTDSEDIICLQNVIDEWDDMEIGDQEITYAIIANVYSTLIDDPDEFIDQADDDGVELRYINGIYYPANVNTTGLQNTLMKANA